MMTGITGINNNAKQRGVVLIISLIMLLMLTLLAVSSMRSTTLEEKMAGNFNDRNTSFQTAEAALRDGERYLRSTSSLPIFEITDVVGLYMPTSEGAPRWDQVNWSDSTAVATYAGELFIEQKPNYIIEQLDHFVDEGESQKLGGAHEYEYFRITSRSVGATGNSIVVLQSTYKRGL